ncbi:MAG: hypothetical protein DRH23_07905 [Deltaproteobacteria bacterium]|nr:MAG: hypothetical protein DRH23_07905 [Deltaproteobacteria bacterium]
MLGATAKTYFSPRNQRLRAAHRREMLDCCRVRCIRNITLAHPTCVTLRGLREKEGRQNVAPLCILRSTGVDIDSGARIRCALVE